MVTVSVQLPCLNLKLTTVYHDELLHDLRRPPEQRRVSKSKAKPQKYAVPHGGLFEYISFPNYFCEW